MPKLAADTNVLARALVSDGSAQSVAAQRLFAEREVFVSDTVLLETERVLRSRFKLGPEVINRLFTALLSTSTVLVDNRVKLLHVIEAHRLGMDFADALHLYNAGDCAAFISFDRELAKLAATLAGTVPVREAETI